jgi:hypothetical protein
VLPSIASAVESVAEGPSYQPRASKSVSSNGSAKSTRPQSAIGSPPVVGSGPVESPTLGSVGLVSPESTDVGEDASVGSPPGPPEVPAVGSVADVVGPASSLPSPDAHRAIVHPRGRDPVPGGRRHDPIRHLAPRHVRDRSWHVACSARAGCLAGGARCCSASSRSAAGSTRAARTPASTHWPTPGATCNRAGAEACNTLALDPDLCALQWTSQFEASAAAADTFELEFSATCFDEVVGAFDELACDEPERPWAWAERTCPVWHAGRDVGAECRPYEMPESFAFVSVCRPGLVCAADPAAGSDAWRCRDVTVDPGEDEGCLRYQGASVTEERCGDALRCDAGVCTTGPGPGDPCDCGGLFGCEGCVDGWCDADVGEAAGTCREFVAVGEACGTALQPQCAYLCDPQSMVCVAPDDAGPLACALSLQL